MLAELSPFEQKELIRLVLRRAEVGDRHVTLEIYPIAPQELAMPQGASRSVTPNWLPELVRQSVLRDTFAVRLPSLVRRVRGEWRHRRNTDVAAEWQAELDSGRASNRADLARRLGLSRARVTRALAAFAR